MSVRIGSNISSIISQRKLGEATGTLSNIYERLSSGQRINKASDDAAGLAIADSLNAKSRIFSQAIRNGNDGISYLNIADSAIAELSGIVVRIRELSEQAANGSYSNQQRKALDSEAQQLSKEFTRITQTTSFNSIKIFSGEGANVLLQLGDGANSTLNASIGGAVGTGKFNNAITFSNGPINSSAFGDLNGDDILDLVTFEAGGGGHSLTTIRLGNGDGSFGSAVSYSGENDFCYSVTLGDLNGDGVLDLITAGDVVEAVTYYRHAVSTVRLGNGDGSFGAAVAYTSDAYLYNKVMLGDLNGDGILDMVAASLYGQAYAEVRLGKGDGTFGNSLSYENGGDIISGLQLGDLNGDDILDLVSVGYRFGSYDSDLKIRFGNGDGTFGDQVSYSMGKRAMSLDLGDLNGDGILDLAMVSSDGPSGYTSIMIGRGDGTFNEMSLNTQDSFYSVHLGDMNGDGILDFVAAGYGGSSVVRTGRGDGTFNDDISIPGIAAAIDGLGDLNGDNVLDIIAVGSSYGVFLASTTSGLGAMLEFSLKDRQSAKDSMVMLDRTLQNLAKQRGTIGASLSRVDTAISNLQSARENFKAAESRIRDTDIAADAAELVRTQILQQAASSVLAQANQAPTLALKLLA